MSGRRASHGQGHGQGPDQQAPPPGQSKPPLKTDDSPDTQTPPKANLNPVFRVPDSPRSGPSESSRKAAKVAIPRLKRSVDAGGEGTTRSGGRHRVTHACEPCRHRKTKCSGERPVCQHCQQFGLPCYYADGKRDRVKKYALYPTNTCHVSALTED
jgi:hypothetical protein